MAESIRGRVELVGDIQQVTDSFKKRDLILIVRTPPDYTNYFKIEYVQDRVNLLNGIQVGEIVECKFDIKGRQYENKRTGKTDVFTTLKGWEIERISGGTSEGVTGGKELEEVLNQHDQEDDGLPF